MRENNLLIMDKSAGGLTQAFVLCLIVALGFALRSYNLNFPAIGYHNMEENGYLSAAQEMKAGHNYAAKKIYFYNTFEQDPGGGFNLQSSLMPYQILFSWKIFGDNIWAVRLCNILFGVLSIIVMYRISLLLFGNAIISLFCAFLLSIMPLAVFFSRTIQAESPAFFFMLLGAFFYLKSSLPLKRYYLFLGGISFSVVFLYKFNFAIGIFPAFFCLPYRSLFKNSKESLKSILVLLTPFVVFLIAVILLRFTGIYLFEFGALERIRVWEIFTYGYWIKYGRMIWWYVQGENFTLFYAVLSLSGILAAFFRESNLLERYILSWAFAIIPYSMICSDFINQHNYFQMPFLPLVCISAAYIILRIWETVKSKKILRGYLLVFLILASVLASFPPVYASISRMYGTVFWGLDVAGESIREFTNPQERIFLSTHAQGKSIARYARRYAGWTDNPDDFKDKEKRFNVRYVCFYPAEFALALKANNSVLFDYIQNNYHVKEVGLTDEPSHIYYVILEKGAGSDPKTFLQSFSGAKQSRTAYRIWGKLMFFYSLRP